MKNQKVKSFQQWVTQSRNNKKLYNFYQGYCLDLTDFANIHPGGSQLLKRFEYKDLTDILFTVFPHNQEKTPRILRKYRIGKVREPIRQKENMTGIILKQRNQAKQISTKKKTVQFASQIIKLASQKQKKYQKQKSLSKSPSKKKIPSVSKRLIKNNIEQKTISKTKIINPDHINKFKSLETKHNKHLQTQKQNSPSNSQNTKQKQHAINYEPSIVNNINSSISVKDHSNGTWTLFPQDIEEAMPALRIPVLRVKFDRVW